MFLASGQLSPLREAQTQDQKRVQLDRHCGSAGLGQQLWSERCDKSKHKNINHKFRNYLFSLHVHILWDKAHFTTMAAPNWCDQKLLGEMRNTASIVTL